MKQIVNKEIHKQLIEIIKLMREAVTKLQAVLTKS
tara:strand:- start:60 stop:164 length:105 start_codon:yes stop_codon:yes gene_type:complete